MSVRWVAEAEGPPGKWVAITGPTTETQAKRAAEVHARLTNERVRITKSEPETGDERDG